MKVKGGKKKHKYNQNSNLNGQTKLSLITAPCEEDYPGC